MKSNIYVVSCDWLSISCIGHWHEGVAYKSMPKSESAKTPRSESGTIDELERAEYEARGFKVVDRDFIGESFETDGIHFVAEKSEEFNPYYDCSLMLSYSGRPFVHVFYKPRAASVDPSSCQYKVANAALYSSQWPSLLRLCLKATRAKFVRINRVDICGDFEYFANGRLPLKFCQDYLSKPTAARPSFIRKSSNKLRAAVTKKGGNLLWETLSWGNRDSAVQVNLYNKTLELETKHDKTYIREKWRDYGLPYENVDGEKKRYVWRVEFSVNPSQKYVQVINTKKGKVKGPLADHRQDLREILISDFDSQAALNRLFESLVPQFFQFYYLHRDDMRAGRRVKDLMPVVLFDPKSNLTNCDADKTLYRFRQYSNARQLGRTERILESRIDKMLENGQLTYDEKVALSGVKTLLDRARLRKEYSNANTLTADDWLQSVLGQSIRHDVDDTNIAHSKARKTRELQRYVRMLERSHDPIISHLSEHLAGLSRLVGGERLPLITSLLRKVDGYIAAADDAIKDAAEGLPEWFFDAPDEVDNIDESDWLSLIESMPKS